MKHLLEARNSKDLLQLLSPQCGKECVLCHLLGESLMRILVLDTLCHLERRGLLVMSVKHGELFRNDYATLLLEKWFPAPPAQESLPQALSAWVRSFLGSQVETPPALEAQTLERDGEALVVELLSLPELPRYSRSCALSLREVVAPRGAPEAWRKRLSPRQFEIASLVLAGESNASIAAHFQTTVGTVKKQVSTVFDRLGVNSRSQLSALAVRQR